MRGTYGAPLAEPQGMLCGAGASPVTVEATSFHANELRSGVGVTDASAALLRFAGELTVRGSRVTAHTGDVVACHPLGICSVLLEDTVYTASKLGSLVQMCTGSKLTARRLTLHNLQDAGLLKCAVAVRDAKEAPRPKPGDPAPAPRFAKPAARFRDDGVHLQARRPCGLSVAGRRLIPRACCAAQGAAGRSTRRRRRARASATRPTRSITAARPLAGAPQFRC
jgi:hypothetical protein